MLDQYFFFFFSSLPSYIDIMAPTQWISSEFLLAASIENNF